MSNQPLEIERSFDTPAIKVWDALTENDQLKEWYFQIADFKPVVGFEFQFIGKSEDNTEYLHLCKILEVVPCKKLVYSWRYKGFPGSSNVSFELFEDKGKTRLKLTHSGLESFAGGGRNFAKENFAEGWTYILDKSLSGYLKS